MGCDTSHFHSRHGGYDSAFVTLPTEEEAAAMAERVRQFGPRAWPVADRLVEVSRLVAAARTLLDTTLPVIEEIEDGHAWIDVDGRVCPDFEKAVDRYAR